MATLLMTPQAKKLAGQITDYVNSFSRERGREFNLALEREHQTLQQSSAKMFLEFLEYAATDEYKIGHRNASTKKISQILMKGFAIAIAEELQKQGQNVTPEDILNNWDVYKPSSWLTLI